MTTLTIDTHRETLLRCLDTGRRDAFLTLVDSYLTACPDDFPMRLLAAREYLKLGLLVPARGTIKCNTLSSNLSAELRRVHDSLSSIPSDIVPWSSRAARFEANVGVLEARGIDTSPIQTAWQARRSRFELFTDNRGMDQVRMRDERGAWRWIPSFADHRAVAEAQPLPHVAGALMPGPYLFEGLDLGWLFRRVYEATHNTFLGYSCALFVVEPDPALVALVMHLHDWTHILSDPRVLWLVGDSSTHRLRKLWADDPDLPIPRHGFTLCPFRPRPEPNAIDIAEATAREQQEALQHSLADIEAQYAPRDARYYARRFKDALSRQGPPLRILAAVSTHTTFLQYSMRDAKRAFESLGHQCVVLTEKTPYTTISPQTYHNAIREFDPDLFFNIDHLRPEFGGLLPTHLPLLTWDQDQLPHVFVRANIERIGTLDFVAGYAKSRCMAAGCNPRQLLQARVPTSPEQFSGPPLTDEERIRYTCDVAYVSHASQTPKAFHEQERAGFSDDKARNLLDTLYELTSPALDTHHVMGGGVALTILEEAARRCGLAMPDGEARHRLVGWYLWRLGDRVFRHQALEWTADWARRTGRSFRIYGNGWDRHPTLAAFAAGPAANGRELLCVYRASRINLQLMPAGFLHQRALDGLVAGGFFLSRTTPSDLRGKLLRRLDNHIRELGIRSTRELLTCADDTLQALLREHQGEWLTRVDPYENDLLTQIQTAAEPLQAEEVFPCLHDILFDSPDAFAAKADRFLADEPARRSITDDMRRVAVEHFSYEATMDRFLRAMAEYLSNTCP